MKKLILVCGLLGLVACDEKQEVYTVDYLYENKDVRNQVLADCKANKQIQENCDNATFAKARRFNETSADKKRLKF